MPVTYSYLPLLPVVNADIFAVKYRWNEYHNNLKYFKLLWYSFHLYFTAKISALTTGKSGKYEYVTGNGILPPDQSRMIG